MCGHVLAVCSIFLVVQQEAIPLQVLSTEAKDEMPFSFLGALDEGYFSDLVIKADSGKEVG